MNQEKISNLIKQLRKKDNLTQAQFANKYNVTFQAVSKWENGKSLPDIVLLKQICKDYNISIDEVLEGEINKKNKYLLLIPLIVILIIGLVFILKKDDFEFKTLSSSCSNFKISGSIAYNNNKSHLHLSNIDYCGNDDNNHYVKIECTLYEKKQNINKELDKLYYDNGEIKLKDFLENIEFDLKDFSKMCRSYDNDSLYLEINATTKDNKTTNYKVSLSINECN
ncbi:MAG: helix-turn-helix transcriptional regulator [Candidatus Faecisoma sp.]|nr:helix-turn-helix domain-containing protein [Acholeplasma sp.]MDY2892644.1 helix-turn-helix transcriptional regulator [Candidatus Faecisoma sp.]